MAQVVEILTVGFCGLGAVIVTGIALFRPPSPPPKKKPRQLKLDFDRDALPEKKTTAS